MTRGHPGTSRWALVWAMGLAVVLLLWWEWFGAQLDSDAVALTRHGAVFQDATGNDRLRDFLKALPPPQAPRVLVLGSSQMITVKRAEGQGRVSVCWRLADELGFGTEIVDLAAGGQQVIESMAVLLGALDEVRPSRVVIGLGLFSMTRSRVRESIPAAFDADRLRAQVEANLPGDLDADRRAALLALTSGSAVEAAERGETVQQRADRAISGWLAERLRAIANRRVLYNRLVDAPLRRDLVVWVGREFRGLKVARTHLIGKSYPVSLDALTMMQKACRARGVPLHVVILPFESTRKPLVYRPEDQKRATADLEALARQTGVHLLDLAAALGPEHFGNYTDGSPDGAHFDAAGHAIVAARIAEHIRSYPSGSQR